MLIKQAWIKKVLRRISLKILDSVENTNNCDFATNGEARFASDLFELFCSKKLARKRVFFDVGANVGSYTEILARHASKLYNQEWEIHAFEPLDACYALLEQKHKKHTSIIVNKVAISDTNGFAMMYMSEATSELASLSQREVGSPMAGLMPAIKVKTMRLDSYVKANNLQHIDLLKMDVEGHELFAIKSLGEHLNSEYIDFIQFEYGGTMLSSKTNLKEIYEVLGKTGFSIAKIMPMGLLLTQYHQRMDNFQYANYVAISNAVLKDLI